MARIAFSESVGICSRMKYRIPRSAVSVATTPAPHPTATKIGSDPFTSVAGIDPLQARLDPDHGDCVV